jgi:hypothetical protein
MSKIDVVLIKPGSQKQLYGDLSDFRLTAIEPPLKSKTGITIKPQKKPLK